MILAVSAIANEPFQSPTTGPTGQICVERLESSGVLNIRRANVVIESGPILGLMGDQAACALVHPGKYTVWVQSPDPYDPNSSDPTAWKSAPISVDVEEHSQTRLHVCGKEQRANFSAWFIGPIDGPCF